MKNQTIALPQEGSAQTPAMKAIQQINSIIDKSYPFLSSFAKSKLLAECLIELNEEKKYIAGQSLS